MRFWVRSRATSPLRAIPGGSLSLEAFRVKPFAHVFVSLTRPANPSPATFLARVSIKGDASEHQGKSALHRLAIMRQFHLRDDLVILLDAGDILETHFIGKPDERLVGLELDGSQHARPGAAREER